MPLWNEIIEISVPSLPSRAVLRLEHCPEDAKIRKTLATFELVITEELHHSFCDEWLVDQHRHSSRSTGCCSDETDEKSHNGSTTGCRLHVSCSFVPEFVEARSKGLWPSLLTEHDATLLATKTRTRWSSTSTLIHDDGLFAHSRDGRTDRRHSEPEFGGQARHSQPIESAPAAPPATVRAAPSGRPQKAFVQQSFRNLTEEDWGMGCIDSGSDPVLGHPGTARSDILVAAPAGRDVVGAPGARECPKRPAGKQA